MSVASPPGSSARAFVSTAARTCCSTGPGLEWAFHELGLNLAEKVPMRRVDQIYQVEAADGSVVRISADLEETVDEIEQAMAGRRQSIP